jgi:hypothetical protein
VTAETDLINAEEARKAHQALVAAIDRGGQVSHACISTDRIEAA